MGVLSADDIDKAPDLAPVPFDVPEWGGQVLLRMPGSEEWITLRDRALAKSDAGEKNLDAVYFMLASALANADGSPMYQDEAEAKAKLGKRSLKVLIRIQRRIAEMHNQEQAEAKKESGEPAETSASPIGLRSVSAA